MLSQKGLEVEERDFFREPLNPEEIRELAGDRSLSELFAWRSPSLKKLGLTGEDLSEDRMLELMQQEPRLIRRPIIRMGGNLLIGGSVKAVEAALDAAG